MPWTLEHFGWPAELESKTYADAKKPAELKPLLADLDTAHHQFTQIMNYPFPATKASTEKANVWGTEALAFFGKGSMPQLRGTLDVITKRAALLAADKKVSSDTKAKALAIAKSAKEHAESVRTTVVTPEINAYMRKMVEADRQHAHATLKMVVANFIAASKKGHPGLQQARHDLQQQWPGDDAGQDNIREQINVGVKQVCRDMSQNVANLVRADGYGVDLTLVGLTKADIKTLPALSRGLASIGNAPGSVTKGKDYGTLAKMLEDIERDAKVFDNIAARLT